MGANVMVRPRPAKREAIVAAARDVFLQHGYEGASVELIASRASVSKQTIYNHFEGKEALFRAISEDLVDDLIAPLLEQTRGASDPRGTLTALGERLLRLALLPSSLALHRLIIAEAQRFPELGRAVYSAGPGRAVEELAAYLQAQTALGNLKVANPRAAAEAFFGMVMGHRHLRALFGVETQLTREQIRDAVATAVDAFLKAHAADDVAG